MKPKRRIVRLAVDEISTVDRPAVNRTFQLYKREPAAHARAGAEAGKRTGSHQMDPDTGPSELDPGEKRGGAMAVQIDAQARQGITAQARQGWDEFGRTLKGLLGLAAPGMPEVRADLRLGEGAGVTGTAADVSGPAGAANADLSDPPPASGPGFPLPGPGTVQTYPGGPAGTIGPPSATASPGQEFQKALGDVAAGQQALAHGLLDVARQIGLLRKSIDEIDAVFGELAGPVGSAQALDPTAANPEPRRSLFAGVV